MFVEELYHINIDPIDQFYFTSAAYEIEYEGNTYLPVSLFRNGLKQGSEMNRQNIAISVDFTNPLAEIFFKEPPEYVAIVTIYRFEKTESENNVLVYWKGRIAGFHATGQEVVFNCESIYTSMRRTGNRAMYQVQCRHALYRTSCGVDSSNYGISATVQSITNLDVSLSLGPPSPHGNLPVDGSGNAVVPNQYFIGGMIEFNGILRFIVNQGVGFVRLWREVPDLAVGETVTVYPGCNRSLSHCKNRFSNTANYGGFPWLPKNNPFSFVNNF